MVASHEKVGGIEVATLQPLTNLGAGYGEFAFDVGRNVLNIKAEGLSAGAQEVHIALPSGTKPMVMAHDDGRNAEAGDQHIAHKVFRL